MSNIWTEHFKTKPNILPFQLESDAENLNNMNEI